MKNSGAVLLTKKADLEAGLGGLEVGTGLGFEF